MAKEGERKLTQARVRKLKLDPERQSKIHFDHGGVPGLGVKVRDRGRPKYVVVYRVHGRQREMTLGRADVLTLDEARKRARAALVRVQDGEDPAEEKKASRQGSTVKELSEAYMKRHAEIRKKTSDEDQRRLDRYVLPALGSRLVADVRRADVAALHARIGKKTPFEANRVLALVAKMFSLAETWGFLLEDAPNPARKIEPFDERKRDRFVSPSEMPLLFQAIELEEDARARAAFKLYLLLGVRRQELLGLKWSQVSVEDKQLRLPETKSGAPHVLPLVSEALAIFEGLRADRVVGNPYVFPGDARGEGGAKRRPRVNIEKSWRRVAGRFWMLKNPAEADELRKAVEEKAIVKKKGGRTRVVQHRVLRAAWLKLQEEGGLRLHDLRRTTGSWLAAGGTSDRLLMKVLNHSSPEMVTTYARLVDDAAREELAKLAGSLKAAGLKAS